MILASVVAAAATALTWLLFATVMLGPCGGDGGEPAADPDSAQGDVCRLLDPGRPEQMVGGEPVSARTWIILFLPAAIILASALAGRLRASARAGLKVGVVLAVAALTLPPLAVVVVP